MSETMLALLGFATIIMIIVLLLKNVTVPAIAFIGVSTVTADSGADRYIYGKRNGGIYQGRRTGGAFHRGPVHFLGAVFRNHDRCGNV